MTPGRTVPVDLILSQAVELFGGPPRVVACDRWRQGELLDGMDKAGLGHVPVDWRGQGYKDGAADLRATVRAILENRVKTKPSLLLAHAISNGRVRVDDAGNRKLIKCSTASGHVIDAFSATVAAVAALERHPPQAWSAAFAPGDGSGEVMVI